MVLERILKNKKLPDGAEAIVNRMANEGDEVLFVIVGDLSEKAKYVQTRKGS